MKQKVDDKKMNLVAPPKIRYGQYRTVLIPFGWVKWAVALYATNLMMVVCYNNPEPFSNGSDLVFRVALGNFATLAMFAAFWWSN